MLPLVLSNFETDKSPNRTKWLRPVRATAKRPEVKLQKIVMRVSELLCAEIWGVRERVEKWN